MICEKHPMLEWPHGTCAGPGCSLSARTALLQRDIRELQIAVQSRDAHIISLYDYLTQKED